MSVSKVKPRERMVIVLICATIGSIVVYQLIHQQQLSEYWKLRQIDSFPFHPFQIESDPEFLHKPETMHVLCGKVLTGDKDHIENITRNRPVLRNHNLNMSCSHIKARVLPPKDLKKLDFGVAYARIVHESYEFIEDEVRSSYHPQNIFCFSVDAKSNRKFYANIDALSKCLPNVLLSPTRYSISRHGHNMNLAHYDCLKLLSDFEGWQYVLLLQNYDMMIKTVYETVSILKELGGANDVCARPCEGNRWNDSANWDARSLKLFRNESQATARQLAGRVAKVRGIIQSALSRDAVLWAVKTVDLTALIKQLNLNVRGADETLWAALQMSDDLEMPGRFTEKCISRKTYVPCISRVAFWHWHRKIYKCPKYRHNVCVFGIEDLQRLSQNKCLMANKPYPDFDYAIVDCVHELLFNKTHLNYEDRPDLQFYSSLENVRYHKNSLNPDPNYKLHCTTTDYEYEFIGNITFSAVSS